MELEALKYIAVGCCAITFLGCAKALAEIFSSVVNGIARNPSAEEKIAKYTFVGAGFTESMGLFALVVALVILFT